MYCKNCGASMDVNAAVCAQCGFQKGTGFHYCQNCGNQVIPGASVCTNCGFALTSPVSGKPVIDQKSKLTAVLLCFFLGSIGIHDFYLGYNRNGIIKIVLTCCTGVGGGIWALIDFIRLLTGSINVDGNGVELKKDF